MIIERTKVLEAYCRARALGVEHDVACAEVAGKLGLPTEAVHAVVTEDVEETEQ